MNIINAYANAINMIGIYTIEVKSQWECAVSAKSLLRLAICIGTVASHMHKYNAYTIIANQCLVIWYRAFLILPRDLSL